ncbi:hypothetical protein MOTE_10300 [Moorella thermoacetica]|uniref:Uncharacterized protein n=1 Tax=Neomoorella thermoacetica TaxID=1525 RepID=A0A1J5NME1_NEOTH|nr:hypothetical protein MOTE_10300 [Moorella thermoacetica]
MPTTFVLLTLLLPGVLFFLTAGKKEELDSPTGWAVAIIVGFFCTLAVTGFFICTARFFKQDILQGVIGFLVSDASKTSMDKYAAYVGAMLNFEIGVYATAFLAGIFRRNINFFPSWAGSVLMHLENRFSPNEGLFISRRLLENFLFAANIAGVVPIMRLHLKTGEIVEGKCLKYHWIKPRSLMLLTKKDEKTSLLIAPLTSIQAVYLLNWPEFKNMKRKKVKEEDEWKYLRYIDPRLPELLEEEQKEILEAKFGVTSSSHLQGWEKK